MLPKRPVEAPRLHDPALAALALAEALAQEAPPGREQGAQASAQSAPIPIEYVTKLYLAQPIILDESR